MKKTISLIVILFTTSISFSAKAQTSDQMIRDWERAKAYTKEYLDVMPEEGYAFKPTPEMRSFADEMMHLANGNFGMAAMASNTISPYQSGTLEKTEDKSKSTVIKTVMDSYDFVIKTIKNMKAEQFAVNVKIANKFEMPASVALAKLFEHQTHMRGQTMVYLRLKGITPPTEKLF